MSDTIIITAAGTYRPVAGSHKFGASWFLDMAVGGLYLPVVADNATTAATPESVQPKVEKPKKWYTFEGDGLAMSGVFDNALELTTKSVVARLDAPHYTQAQVNEARANEIDRIACFLESSSVMTPWLKEFIRIEYGRAAALRKGGA